MTNEFRTPPAGGPHLRTGNGSTSTNLVPWLVGALVVITLAVAGGFITAWIVAESRAVPGPIAGQNTPTPLRTAPGAAPASPDGLPTATTSDPPRRTPTPSPVVSIEPEPFVHVVVRGESLSEIAALYGVELDDIVALNEIRNPNRIQVGQELLIPGYGTPP